MLDCGGASMPAMDFRPIAKCPSVTGRASTRQASPGPARPQENSPSIRCRVKRPHTIPAPPPNGETESGSAESRSGSIPSIRPPRITGPVTVEGIGAEGDSGVSFRVIPANPHGVETAWRNAPPGGLCQHFEARPCPRGLKATPSGAGPGSANGFGRMQMEL